MSDFRLPEDQEKIRAALFPDMSPADYAAMVERKRADFAALPESQQERLLRKLDSMDAELAASRAKVLETNARFWTGAAIRKAKHKSTK